MQSQYIKLDFAFLYTSNKLILVFCAAKGHTNNTLAEREIEKTIPFIVTTKRIISSSKEVKDLYPENYKTLLKEIKRRQKNPEKY